MRREKLTRVALVGFLTSPIIIAKLLEVIDEDAKESIVDGFPEDMHPDFSPQGKQTAQWKKERNGRPRG